MNALKLIPLIVRPRIDFLPVADVYVGCRSNGGVAIVLRTHFLGRI